ncbi:TZF5, partial [Symbiodinium sp. KB8]
MHSVWLIDVLGDPVYTARKVCSTKIDPMTGKCKKTDDGCATDSAEAPRVLAAVHLADWTGQLSSVLVGGPELALLARVNDEQVIAYMLLTGAPPFFGSDDEDIAELQVKEALKVLDSPPQNQLLTLQRALTDLKHFSACWVLVTAVVLTLYTLSENEAKTKFFPTLNRRSLPRNVVDTAFTHRNTSPETPRNGKAGTVELRDPRGIGRESGKGLAPLDRPHRRIEGLQNLSVRLAASSSDGANYVSMEVVFGIPPGDVLGLTGYIGDGPQLPWLERLLQSLVSTWWIQDFIDKCQYSHDDWLRRNPSKVAYEPDLCPNLSTCQAGRKCGFAHSQEEVLYHPRRYKTSRCYASGCRGYYCPDAHYPHERREPKEAVVVCPPMPSPDEEEDEVPSDGLPFDE